MMQTAYAQEIYSLILDLKHQIKSGVPSLEEQEQLFDVWTDVQDKLVTGEILPSEENILVKALISAGFKED